MLFDFGITMSHIYWGNEGQVRSHIDLVLDSWQKASAIKIVICKIWRLLENVGTRALIGFNLYNSFSAAHSGICHCLTTWTLCYQPETQHICHSFFSSWCFPDCSFRSLLKRVGRVTMQTFFMHICCYGISVNPLTSYHIAEWKGFLLIRGCNAWKTESTYSFLFHIIFGLISFSWKLYNPYSFMA